MVVEISMLLEVNYKSTITDISERKNNHILLKDYFQSYNGNVHSTLWGTYEWIFD